VPKSTIGAYLNDWNGRHWAFWQGCSVDLPMDFSLWAGKLLDLLLSLPRIQISPLFKFEEQVLSDQRMARRKTASTK